MSTCGPYRPTNYLSADDLRRFANDVALTSRTVPLRQPIPVHPQPPLLDLDEKSPGNQFDNTVHKTFSRIAGLVIQRHQKYGPRNISNSPGGPLNGILVRLHDKMSRLANGLDNHQDESVEDTLSDIAGYAAIGLLVLRGEWPA